MKKHIIIMLILLPVNLFAQSKDKLIKIISLLILLILISNFAYSQGKYFKSEVLDFIKKELKTNVITSKVEKTNLFSRNTESKLTDSARYQSFSFGLGLTTFNYYDLSDYKLVLSLGISHQLSKSFFLEAKFDYCPKTENDEQVYIFSGIPQFAFNLLEDNLKLKMGLGLFLLGVPKSGAIIFLVADAKVEYNLSKEVSIYPEIRFIPLLFTFNVSYKLPLKNK